MPQGGIYRFDPPPQQQGPRAPIPAQGDQPPRPAARAVITGVIIGMWPTGMEAGLPQLPNRRYIAPLTIAYGQQPPAVGTQNDLDIQASVYFQSWIPPATLPTLPNRRYIAPQTLSYGDQPPRMSNVNAGVILRSWTPPDQQPVQLTESVVVFAYIPDNPPGGIFRQIQAVVRGWWNPPDPQPLQQGPIAPLTLTYGQQPPPRRMGELPFVPSAWEVQTIQQARVSIAPLISVVLAQPPFSRDVQNSVIVAQWQPGPWSIPRPVSIAPLTLAYGQQPPLISGSLIRQSVARMAWEPPPPMPQRDPKNLAPLTLIYGDSPPIMAGMNDADFFASIVNQWQPPPPLPQRDPKNIAPLTLRYGDQPPLIARDLVNRRAARTAWEPPDPKPQTKPAMSFTAPLVIVYGDQPPRTAGYRGANFTTILGSWVPPPPLPQTLPTLVSGTETVSVSSGPMHIASDLCYEHQAVAYLLYEQHCVAYAIYEHGTEEGDIYQ